MNITPSELDVEYRRALAAWPFIPDIEHQFGLPRMMLFAVGSRETNLTNETGDGGHGHGVWQLDDRSHTIPSPFIVEVQAQTAAQMLRALIKHFTTNNPKLSAVSHLQSALAAYNAGAGTVDYNLSHGLDLDSGTAHADYAADTYARMMYLQTAFPIGDTMPTTAAEFVALLKDPAVRAELKEVLAEATIGNLIAWDHRSTGTIESYFAGVPGYETYASRFHPEPPK